MNILNSNQIKNCNLNISYYIFYEAGEEQRTQDQSEAREQISSWHITQKINKPLIFGRETLLRSSAAPNLCPQESPYRSHSFCVSLSLSFLLFFNYLFHPSLSIFSLPTALHISALINFSLSTSHSSPLSLSSPPLPLSFCPSHHSKSTISDTNMSVFPQIVLFFPI